MKIRNFQNKFYLIIFILIVAAILRFYEVNQPLIDATSWRESDTATIADNFYHGNWNIFYPEISWNGPGPNYVGYEFQTLTYITACLYHLFGQHDWIARSVPILFGLWGIFAFYQLVCHVWNEKYAVASTAVMAILPGSIYVDRTFVPDPVMVSLIVTSFWLLVVYLQKGHWYYLLLASLAGMLGLLTKISGVIVGIPMAYVSLTMMSSRRTFPSKQAMLIGVAAFLVAIPVIAYYLWAIHISLTYPPYYAAAGSYWVWKFGLHRFLEQNYFIPKLFTQLNWFCTKPIMVLVAAGFFLRPLQGGYCVDSESQLRKRGVQAPWLFHWWMIAFSIYYLLAAQGLVGNPTNLNIINPAVAALAGNALVSLMSLAQRVAGSPASVAVITIVLLLIGRTGYKDLKGMYYPWAENGHKLGLTLRQITQPSDLVITIAETIGDPVAIYYSQRRGWVFPPVMNWSLNWWDEIKDDREAIRLLDELRIKGANWIGIVSEQKKQIWRNNPELVEYIKNNGALQTETAGFVIYRFPKI